MVFYTHAQVVKRVVGLHNDGPIKPFRAAGKQIMCTGVAPQSAAYCVGPSDGETVVTGCVILLLYSKQEYYTRTSVW